MAPIEVIRWLLVPLSFCLFLSSSAWSSPPAPRPRYTLNIALVDGGAAVEGEVRIAFQNTSPEALSEVVLWLYPNRFDEKPPYMTELTQPYFYPGRFDPAALEILSLHVEGKEAALGNITYERGVEGERLFARIPLDLSPGEEGRVALGFRTTIPKRFGRFGRTKNAIMLDGGFYPALAALTPEGFSTKAPPAPADFSLNILAPDQKGFFWINGEGPFPAGEETSVALKDAPYLSCILLRRYHERRRQAGAPKEGSGLSHLAGDEGEVLYYYTDKTFHDLLQKESRWETGPPGLDSYQHRDYPEEVLDTVVSGLSFLSSQKFLPGKKTIRLLEVPMRERVALYAPGVVLVSDWAMKIYPSSKILKYHKLQVLRAVYGLLIEEAIKGFEHRDDIPWVADALGAFFSDLYHKDKYPSQDFAKELLKPYSFISEIDELRWNPQLRFKEEYFHSVYEKDLFRDDVRRFGNELPYGRLIYNKLEALLGESSFLQLATQYMQRADTPFRSASESFYQNPLDWFYQQWLGPYPEINYKLVRFASTPSKAGYRHEIFLQKEGDVQIREPVEVFVIDRAGDYQVLIWPMDDVFCTLFWESAAPLARVIVDPRAYTHEQSADIPDDLRLDNTSPGRLRVVIDGFDASFSSGGLVGDTSISARRAHDKRSFYFLGTQLASGTLLASDAPTPLRVNSFAGVFVGYHRGFGDRVGEDKLTTLLGFSLLGEKLGPRLFDDDQDTTPDGVFSPGSFLQLTLQARYLDRLAFYAPWKGTDFQLDLSYSLGATEEFLPPSLAGEPLDVRDLCQGARKLCQSVSLRSSWSRLFSLDGGRVVGLRAGLSALFGRPLGQSFFDLGGPDNLKAYPTAAVQGRARALGAVEYRQPILKHLDVNLAEIDRWRSLGVVFWAAGASISEEDAIFGGEARSLFGAGSFFAEAGVGLRFFSDIMGIDPAVLSLDFAVPLVGNEALSGGPFPPLQVHVGFEENF